MCSGIIFFYRLDTDPIDAYVISFNFAAGWETYFTYLGVDVIWTSRGLVVFTSTPAYVDEPYADPPHDQLSPQFGVSLTYSEITSAIIRERPGPGGIVEAWSGHAMQEGASLLFVTVTSSSSADSSGNPNFQTTSTGGGYSLGIPDIILEYHRYVTDAQPVPYLVFDR